MGDPYKKEATPLVKGVEIETLILIVDMYLRYNRGERGPQLIEDARALSARAGIPDVFDEHFRITPFGCQIWPVASDCAKSLAKLAAGTGGHPGVHPLTCFLIGSAHIDILASYESDQEEFVDKIGNLRFGVGGTAYQVARNLVKLGASASLWTALPRGSLSAEFVASFIKDAGIDDRYVQVSPFDREPAFVAHMSAGDLQSAVSSTVVEDALMATETISDGIQSSACTMVDANLSPAQITAVSAIADSLSRPLIGAAVSEPKCRRLACGARYALCSMNSREFSVLLPHGNVMERPEEACAAIGASTIVVTLGDDGYIMAGTEGGAWAFRQAPENVGIETTAAAGDALLAALIFHYLNTSAPGRICGRDFWSDAHPCVSKAVAGSLSSVSPLLRPFDIRETHDVGDAKPAAPIWKRLFGRR